MVPAQQTSGWIQLTLMSRGLERPALIILAQIRCDGFVRKMTGGQMLEFCNLSFSDSSVLVNPYLG
jgi:hypothetical protein